MDPLNRLFANLDRWRHFPDYHLERRADALFSVYLSGAIERLTGHAIAEPVIPELPLRKGTLWGEDRPDRNLSVKVDYALFAADRSRVFLVELKTDDGSRNDAQDEYLRRAAELGFGAIAEGVRRIAQATSAHRKYHHLLAALSRHGIMKLPPQLAEHTFPHPRHGLKRQLEAIEVLVRQGEWSVEVLYVQPTLPPGCRGLDFHAFADHVAAHDDPLSALFAKHLRRWSIRAADAPPA